MFIRQQFKLVNGRRRAYGALVESYRTERGPRQRVVAWLGQIDGAGRLGVQEAAEQRAGTPRQRRLFDEPEPPQWVEVDASAVRVENCRQFGGPWLALELIRRLGLDKSGRVHETKWNAPRGAVHSAMLRAPDLYCE